MKVLITNCTVNSALAIMRTLHSEGAEVIGADARRLPFDLHSSCAPPYEKIAPNNSSEFVKSVLGVIDKHKPDALLPCVGAAECSQAKEILSQSTNVLVPDFDAFRAVNDKRLIFEQCKQSAIRTPELLDVDSAKKSLRSGFFEAVVVKPRDNLGGGKGVSIVSNADELDRLIEDIEGRFGEALISEFVPGPDGGNIAIQLVFDSNSRLVGHFGLQKTRLQPAGVGIAGAAVSVHRIDLLQLILPMFTRLRWQGLAEVEFKIDSRTGQAWLIEVNARFSGSVAFAIACGVNLPFISCQAAMGIELPESTTPAYPEGVTYWNPIMYTRAIVAAFRRGDALTALPAQICNELRGDRVGNPYRLSDPAPLIGKALFEFREWFSKRLNA
jgi:predicted ATP-grasp superfamily ATP-dependent carboligase